MPTAHSTVSRSRSTAAAWPSVAVGRPRRREPPAPPRPGAHPARRRGIRRRSTMEHCGERRRTARHASFLVAEAARWNAYHTGALSTGVTPRAAAPLRPSRHSGESLALHHATRRRARHATPSTAEHATPSTSGTVRYGGGGRRRRTEPAAADGRHLAAARALRSPARSLGRRTARGDRERRVGSESAQPSEAQRRRSAAARLRQPTLRHGAAAAAGRVRGAGVRPVPRQTG